MDKISRLSHISTGPMDMVDKVNELVEAINTLISDDIPEPLSVEGPSKGDNDDEIITVIYQCNECGDNGLPCTVTTQWRKGSTRIRPPEDCIYVRGSSSNFQEIYNDKD